MIKTHNVPKEKILALRKPKFRYYTCLAISVIQTLAQCMGVGDDNAELLMRSIFSDSCVFIAVQFQLFCLQKSLEFLDAVEASQRIEL